MTSGAESTKPTLFLDTGGQETGDPEESKLLHGVLADIAKIFLESQLGTEEEAYVCMIPDLAAAEKLPSWNSM